MKRYNLSDIMKRAHQLYRNARAKYPTFSDALRKSWSMAKFSVRISDSRKAIEAAEAVAAVKREEAIQDAEIQSVLLNAKLEADRIRSTAEAEAERMRAEIAARKEGITYNEYQERITRAMGYGCGCYCGD